MKRQKPEIKIHNIPDGIRKGMLHIESGRTLRAHELETIERLLCFGRDIVCKRELNLPYSKSPDIVWRDEQWEIKYAHGDSAHNIANALRKAKKQSQSIVIDISGARREIENAIPQVKERMYNSKRIKKVLVLSKNRYCLISRSML